MAKSRRHPARNDRSPDVLDSALPITSEGVGRQDWEVADRSRPDLPDENEDGLDELEESVRHVAEDIPLAPPADDDPVLPFGVDGKPGREPTEAVRNEAA